PDFDEEARKLFALLNLPSGAASDESSRLHGYHNLDAVWQHPTTGAQVFIGNATASSQPRTQLNVLVNCTSDMSNTFDGVAYVMHAADLDHQTAIVACKRCRPAVDPIGDLTTLLAQLDAARQACGS
ncbi:unnamed protein product, partial [Effrenium voratum]